MRSPLRRVGSVNKAVVAAVAGVLAVGCTASGDETKPKQHQLSFPTGAAISPDGRHLFVANANSDLGYDSGSISVVPITSVEAAITAWVSPAHTMPTAFDPCFKDDDEDKKNPYPCCHQDSNFTETLVCEELVFFDTLAGVRIGNFATDIALQDLSDPPPSPPPDPPPPRFRLMVPTRGDPSIAWADWDPEAKRLTCNTKNESEGETFVLCDDEHRLSFVLNNSDLAAIQPEPFGVFADSAGEFAIVTHLTTGAVTLIDSPRNGLAQVTDVASGMFDPDPVTGRPGATSVAGRNPKAPDDIIYVGSRTDDRIQTFTVGRPVNDSPPFLLDGGWFHLDAVGNDGNPNGASNDTRGMAFSPSGDRMYLVNRKPPSLQVIDTSIGATGFPNNETIGATDICRQASTVAVIDPGDGERAYVSCFQDGQIYVVNPNGRVRVEDIIIVGRGPYSAVAAPDGKWLYVTNFLEDSIAVIDLRPGSPTRNRVVLRIGEPRIP